MSHIPRLLERATARDVRQASTMAATLNGLDPSELVAEYREVNEAAPNRGADGYTYFRARTGRPPQSKRETRREERLAMALVNDGASVSTSGETIDMITYAFPLYTTGGPKGMRAVDVVGHAFQTRRFWVVELKIAAGSGYGETPLRALYEALIYGAVIEGNTDHIAPELEHRGRTMDHARPGLLIAAPTEYWARWTPNDRIRNWWNPFRSLTSALSEELETPVETVSLGRISYRIGSDGRPRVDGQIDCQPVSYS